MNARRTLPLVAGLALLLILSTIPFRAQTAPAGQPLTNSAPSIWPLAGTQSIPQVVWPDTIVVMEEWDADAALDRLEAGELDVYAEPITDPALAQRIADSPYLEGDRSFSNYCELTLNPAGPVFSGTGKLNPFAVPRVRAALNWLVDRDYIAHEIYGGLAEPRWLPIHPISADYAGLADAARALELEYGYDPERARQVIAHEMRVLGATLVGGLWRYQGEPVEIIVLIRTEDQRRQIGDYVTNQLEALGFSTHRHYGRSAELAPIWLRSDPNLGLWHIYTGGWVASSISRDESINFDFFYTPRGMGVPLWQAYTPTPEFDALAGRLAEGDYSSMAERRAMMAQALEWAQEDSVRVWLIDRAGVTARRTEVSYAPGLFGGLTGSTLWPHTLRRAGDPGEPLTMTVAMLTTFIDPWNPLNGSSWLYDKALIHATGEPATMPDPFTGLAWPQRIARAELYAVEGLPISSTLDWIDLQFVPEIQVPADAWVDWDAAEQRFLTAGEVYTETRTALRKSVVYYPADLTTTVTWHDGSPFTAADMVLYMILTFDRAKPESAVYDEAVVPAFYNLMTTFKGVRIVSTDPLVVEHYGDDYQLDAELSINAWWPLATGPAAWHAVTLGLMAEAAGQAAFTFGKAEALQVEWLDYISGNSLPILAGQLDQALAASYIPYGPTLGQYITTAQADARWQRLAQWYAEQGHFWIGTGPYTLEQAQPLSGTLTLRRYPAYPDAVDRWAAFAAAPIVEIALTGPVSVARGTTATFDVGVTFEGQPYATADVQLARYLLIDAWSNLVRTGDAEAVDDGLWQIALDGNETEHLPAGPLHMEVIVTPRRVVVPTFAGHDLIASAQETMEPGIGGTLVCSDSLGQVVTITVPGHALTQTITLTCFLTPSVVPPAGFLFVGLAFDLDAYLSSTLQPGFRFAAPVTVSIGYLDGRVGGLDEGQLALHYWDETAAVWNDAAETCVPAAPYTRSPAENRLAVPICHLSRFALLGPVRSFFLPLVRR